MLRKDHGCERAKAGSWDGHTEEETGKPRKSESLKTPETLVNESTSCYISWQTWILVEYELFSGLTASPLMSTFIGRRARCQQFKMKKYKHTNLEVTVH